MPCPHDQLETPSLDFLAIFAPGVSRKTVATSFFELLVLKSTDYVAVQQETPFQAIQIQKTVRPARPARPPA